MCYKLVDLRLFEVLVVFGRFLKVIDQGFAWTFKDPLLACPTLTSETHP